MIKHLHIKNFKSIKDLEFDCARVNVFIGEPNTGKSNILEAIGMFSMTHKESGVNSINSIYYYVRAEETKNLFYNNIIDEPIMIRSISTLGDDILSIIFNLSEFLIECSDLQNKKIWIEAHIDKNLRNNQYPKYSSSQVLPIRFYRYETLKEYPGKELDFLNPPFGDNLLSLIKTRKTLKEFVLDLFKNYNYKFQAFEDLNKMYFVRDIKDELVSLPFHLLSDTLLRLIFYYAAIELSKQAVLVLEEPEAHVFPFYNEQLALMISENSNQFFIATHNPHFLNKLIDKTPSEQLNVFKVTYKDYQTHVKSIDKNTLQKFVINDNDILLNIDRLGEDL